MASCCGAATCSAVCSACGKVRQQVSAPLQSSDFPFHLYIRPLTLHRRLQRRDPNRLRPHPPGQLDPRLDNAHAVGDRKTAAPHALTMRSWTAHGPVLRLVCRAPHQLRARPLPPAPGRPAGRRALVRRTRAPASRTASGPQDHRVAGPDRAHLLHPRRLLHVLGQLRCALICAMLFLVLGLILLVDLAHTWAEYCLAQIEDSTHGSGASS